MGVQLPQKLDMTRDRLAAADLRRSLRGPAIACLSIVGAFYLVFGVWAALAPLASAAVAQGLVSPEGSRKTVQHLEGGIIKTIHVKEGDRINKGDLLITLDDTQTRATYAALQVQATRYTAMKMRIEALQTMAPTLDLVTPFKDAMSDPELAQFIANEMRIFETRRRTLDQQKAIFEQQIQQSNEEIRGYDAQIKSTQTQLEFIDYELSDSKELLDKGLARKPRVFELQRNRASLTGNEGQLVQSVAKARQKIGEIQLSQIDLDNRFFNEQNELLTKVNSDAAQVEERLGGARDVLTRTDIRAPTTGIIVNLRFKSPRGVIRAGEPIVDIVPTDEDLVIEARISPNDIDVIKPGLPAQIHLTPMHMRYNNLLHGTLREVSADSLADDKTGQRYYTARVIVDREALKELGDFQLSAGMPAEVFINTGERTLLAYLVQPFTRSIRRSFREK